MIAPSLLPPLPATEEELKRCATHRHYKGGWYQVVCEGTDEVTLEPVVTYRNCWPAQPNNPIGKVWTRKRRVFLLKFDPILQKNWSNEDRAKFIELWNDPICYSLTEIAAKMGKNKNQAAGFSRRLIKAGIIQGRGYMPRREPAEERRLMQAFESYQHQLPGSHKSLMRAVATQEQEHMDARSEEETS